MSSGIARSGGRARRALLAVAGLAALAGSAAAQNAAPGAPKAGMTSTAAQPAGAVDPQRLALAREYIRESRIDAAMRGMFANLARQTPQLSADSASDAKARQFVNSFSVGMDAALPMLMDAMTETTARVFTTQELKDLVAFYGSPSGQSMVAKMPAMMQELVPQVFQMMPKVYEIAEADYCRHVTCTQADHDRFQRLESSLRARAGAPPPQ
jgi:hypothetical protein